jgi:phage nucleotide-binding protein
MANALIYTQSGGGKTVNSTLVAAPKRKRNLLICTDNSSIVLTNFERPNLTVQNVSTVKEFVEAYQEGYQSKKYDNIILDNLSDLIDMWLLELDASGKFKDFRQAYQLVYQSLKRLSRESTTLDCNTIFTAWSDTIEITLPTGEVATRLQPKIPVKILDNVCGLMNVVAYINTATDKDGNKRWYYVTEGKPTLIAKDQIACRKSCMPEDIFTIPSKTK